MKRRAAIGLFASVAGFCSLFAFAEMPDFSAVMQRIRPAMLVPFVVSAAVAALLLALRWRQLADCSLGFFPALSASLVGTGENMLLPLRGGDLLKVLRTSSNGAIPLSASPSSLVVEKALDLTVTTLIAALSTGILLNGHSKLAPAALFAACATLAVLVLGFVLVLATS